MEREKMYVLTAEETILRVNTIRDAQGKAKYSERKQNQSVVPPCWGAENEDALLLSFCSLLGIGNGAWGYWVVFFLQQISYSNSDKAICRLSLIGLFPGFDSYCDHCQAEVLPAHKISHTGKQDPPSAVAAIWACGHLAGWSLVPEALYSCSHEYGKCPSSFCVFKRVSGALMFCCRCVDTQKSA